ncbi:MAG: hypothetical protein R2764_01040 [Bacteroidales bacterium]
MKTIKLSLVITLLGFFALQLSAGEEFTKKISKSFDVSKDAVLSVKNKFGKVNCINWDKNSISIEVTITVEASNQEKANKYFNGIDIAINGSSDRVTAVTTMEGKAFDSNNNEFSIDYMINMPKSISVEIDNKFGDILLDEVQGPAKIDLGYGTLNAKRLVGDANKLSIKFSEGFIGYVKTADLELQYSELEIEEVNDMVADSKFSELQLGKVDVLTLETSYDDDFIGSVRDLDVEADFSDVEIRSLSERLIAEFDYGDLKVKDVDKSFKLIELSNSFSDAKIGFHSEASYRLSATVKMGDLNYPHDKARLSIVDLSYTSNKYEGVVGDDPDTSSKVIVEAKNSGVNLYYR